MFSVADILKKEFVHNDYSDILPEVNDIKQEMQVDDSPEDDNGEEETYRIPTQDEVNEQVRLNEQIRIKKVQEDLQNQTHGDKCGSCIKFTRQTPNPRSIMAYCVFHGVMVNKNQASCDVFRKKIKDSFSPEGE